MSVELRSLITVALYSVRGLTNASVCHVGDPTRHKSYYHWLDGDYMVTGAPSHSPFIPKKGEMTTLQRAESGVGSKGEGGIYDGLKVAL